MLGVRVAIHRMKRARSVGSGGWPVCGETCSPPLTTIMAEDQSTTEINLFAPVLGDSPPSDYFRRRWPTMVEIWDRYENDDFYLIDEGHASYWDQDLWKASKDKFKGQTSSMPHTPYYSAVTAKIYETFILKPEAAKSTLARVTIPPNDAEDMSPVALLLDWEEYLGVLARFTHNKLLLDGELK